GVLLYQLLTGQPPFRGASYVEVEEMHLHAPAPRPSASVPSAARFDPVVARCLEKDRASRFSTVATVIDEVKRAFDGRADSTLPARAIGLYVEVRSLAQGDAVEEADERLETMLESARQACEQSSMALALDTGESFLAVCPLPGDEGVERDARERILAMA